MNKTKYALPKPVDGLILLEENTSYKCSFELPEGVKIVVGGKNVSLNYKTKESLVVDKAHKEQIAEHLNESNEIEKALRAKAVRV